MSYDHILTLTPEFKLEESIEFKTLLTELPDGDMRARAKWSHGLRNYTLQLYAITKSSMDTIWDFFISRRGAWDPFLVKIPTEYQVVAEAIGTGDGTAVEFMLDEFPVDTSATFTMYADGTAVTATLANDYTGEFSTVTFASAPGADAVLTGDYEFYFYVSFVDDTFSRELIAYQLLNAGINLRENRWVWYRPRGGNQTLLKVSVSDSISITFSVASSVADIDTFNTVTITESITVGMKIFDVSVFNTVTITESITVSIT